MAKIYGYFEYDDSLTPGHSDDGGLSQLLFNSEGKLSDHATFYRLFTIEGVGGV
ncbi:MAG: hypothetical protein ACTH4Y_07930 [Microbacterium gubbeenense]|uniref:hypothetical protein n=1 Tax=Microbacterium TaxID=33882 RepID=UPI003F99AD2F